MSKVINKELGKKISLLKDYFSKRSEVSMAFVFGSYAKARAMKESDFDVAVYFKPEGRNIEWEEEREYPSEDQIWGDVEEIVGIDTDLVVLNRAPSTLSFAVIQEGIPIIIKDPSLYMEFYLIISSAAEYFREFVKDFWEIKQRSMSLSEIDKERLIKKVDFLEMELSDFPRYKDLTQEVYESNRLMRREVERWVENIANCSIDIAKILLASEKKRIPQTYKEIVRDLMFIGFDRETAKKLSEFAKLRNILAHEYLDIRFGRIEKFIREVKPLYEKLLNFAKNLLSGKQ